MARSGWVAAALGAVLLSGCGSAGLADPGASTDAAGSAGLSKAITASLGEPGVRWGGSNEIREDAPGKAVLGQECEGVTAFGRFADFECGPSREALKWQQSLAPESTREDSLYRVVTLGSDTWVQYPKESVWTVNMAGSVGDGAVTMNPEYWLKALQGPLATGTYTETTAGDRTTTSLEASGCADVLASAQRAASTPSPAPGSSCDFTWLARPDGALAWLKAKFQQPPQGSAGGTLTVSYEWLFIKYAKQAAPASPAPVETPQG